MTFYHVSFNDKDLAKKLGAKFVFDLKLFSAHNDGVASVMSAQIKPMSEDEVEDLRLGMELKELKGEDRSFGGNGLFVDIFPASCFFKNVRSDIKESHWRVLSKLVRSRAGGRCDICGFLEDPSTGQYLDAHERWHYDDATKVQKMMRIVSLCRPCHLYTHMGYASLQGKAEEAIAHKMKISGMSRAEVDREIEAAFKLWEQRNKSEWVLDLGVLVGSGINYIDNPWEMQIK
jgi:hypothetical protein